MKFVTLALALFAVGCQAASLQADAPAPPLPYLEHALALMTHIKQSAHNIADKITDEDIKQLIKGSADGVYTHIQSLAPLINSAVATIGEATQDLHTSIKADIEALKTETEPMRVALREVIGKHVIQYREFLQPIMTEYQEKQEQQLTELRGKLEPNLRNMIAENVEETKTALMPIIDAVKDKVYKHVENVRKTVEPYVTEYQEQIGQAYSQAKSINYEEVKKRLAPHLDQILIEFKNLTNAISEIFVHTSQ